MYKKQNQKIETPPTVITLTLPTPEGGGIAPELYFLLALTGKRAGDIVPMHKNITNSVT